MLFLAASHTLLAADAHRNIYQETFISHKLLMRAYKDSEKRAKNKIKDKVFHFLFSSRIPSSPLIVYPRKKSRFFSHAALTATREIICSQALTPPVSPASGRATLSDLANIQPTAARQW
jgi:hypothetical protein